MKQQQQWYLFDVVILPLAKIWNGRMVQGHSFENLWIWIGYFDDDKVTGLYCLLWTCWLCGWLLLLRLSGTIKVFVDFNIGWYDNFYIGFIPTKIRIWRSFTLLEKKRNRKKNKTIQKLHKINCHTTNRHFNFEIECELVCVRVRHTHTHTLTPSIKINCCCPMQAAFSSSAPARYTFAISKTRRFFTSCGTSSTNRRCAVVF